eukprot:3954260-Ditylum_brightwellii.AAC.1
MTTQPAAKTVITVCTSTPPMSFWVNNFDKPPLLPGLDTPKQEKAEKRLSTTLLTVTQQQYTNTTLEQLDADDTNQAQSIISGLDLSHEQENLAVYCPRVWRNMRLDTQWHLKSMA